MHRLEPPTHLGPQRVVPEAEEEEEDGRTKSSESRQCASAPEVSLNMRAGMSPQRERFGFYEEAWFDFLPNESWKEG